MPLPIVPMPTSVLSVWQFFHTGPDTAFHIQTAAGGTWLTVDDRKRLVTSQNVHATDRNAFVKKIQSTGDAAFLSLATQGLLYATRWSQDVRAAGEGESVGAGCALLPVSERAFIVQDSGRAQYWRVQCNGVGLTEHRGLATKFAFRLVQGAMVYRLLTVGGTESDNDLGTLTAIDSCGGIVTGSCTPVTPDPETPDKKKVTPDAKPPPEAVTPDSKAPWKASYGIAVRLPAPTQCHTLVWEAAAGAALPALPVLCVEASLDGAMFFPVVGFESRRLPRTAGQRALSVTLPSHTVGTFFPDLFKLLQTRPHPFLDGEAWAALDPATRVDRITQGLAALRAGGLGLHGLAGQIREILMSPDLCDIYCRRGFHGVLEAKERAFLEHRKALANGNTAALRPLPASDLRAVMLAAGAGPDASALAVMDRAALLAELEGFVRARQSTRALRYTLCAAGVAAGVGLSFASGGLATGAFATLFGAGAEAGAAGAVVGGVALTATETAALGLAGTLGGSAVTGGSLKAFFAARRDCPWGTFASMFARGCITGAVTGVVMGGADSLIEAANLSLAVGTAEEVGAAAAAGAAEELAAAAVTVGTAEEVGAAVVAEEVGVMVVAESTERLFRDLLAHNPLPTKAVAGAAAPTGATAVAAEEVAVVAVEAVEEVAVVAVEAAEEVGAMVMVESTERFLRNLIAQNQLQTRAVAGAAGHSGAQVAVNIVEGDHPAKGVARALLLGGALGGVGQGGQDLYDTVAPWSPDLIAPDR